jgi:hypothetical protein
VQNARCIDPADRDDARVPGQRRIRMIARPDMCVLMRRV